MKKPACEGKDADSKRKRFVRNVIVNTMLVGTLCLQLILIALLFDDRYDVAAKRPLDPKLSKMRYDPTAHSVVPDLHVVRCKRKEEGRDDDNDVCEETVGTSRRIGVCQ